jgi:4-diphosphocytidyl-2-C-methyl-D-erythritol kinase
MTAAVTVERAPAKLNLALHVRRRRSDGYHEIQTLFAFCRDGDVVTIDEAERDSFNITGTFATDLPIPSEETVVTNLVTRAAHDFVAAFGIKASHAITLRKDLPIASGIGGGSADAAATLRGLARRHDVALDDPMLVRVATGLGADVPACLLGRTAIGTGRGDDLTPIDGWAGTPVLLVNPRVAVSTAAVFAAWDGVDRGALNPADVAAARNDLEPPARRLAPTIDDVLHALGRQSGASLVRMSGSGATCFALFRDGASRDAATAALRAAHPGWWTLATDLVDGHVNARDEPQERAA